MTEATLTISFTNSTTRSNPYWLRMELVEEETIMTISEAAAIIDELYHIDICDEIVSEEEVTAPEVTDWDAVLATINLPVCDSYLSSVNDDDPGAYDVQVKVYRSHQSEIYKLILSNGAAYAPIRTTERVELTLVIEEQSSYLLDTPIVGNPIMVWTDIDGPEITILGNLLYWDGEVTGTIRAEFDTVYDLVDIHVTGINNTVSEIIEGTTASQWLGTGWYSGSETGEELTDVQDIECSLLAFYHYQYEELILNKPEDDESVDSDSTAAICQQVGSTFVNPDDDGSGTGSGQYDEAQCKADCRELYSDDPAKLEACLENCERECFKRVRRTNVCVCGGEETEVEVDVPVPCPPGYNEGSILNGGEVEDGGYFYVDCGHDEVHDPGFYEEKCCVPPNFTLPYCEVKYESFTGKDERDLEEEEAAFKAKYGENVNIISVGPIGSRCGEKITTQKIKQGNCCDGATALVWDHDDSVTEMGDWQAGNVFVSGGLDVLSVSIRGQGFYLDSLRTIRDIDLDFSGGIPGAEKAIDIFTGDACGAATVTVTDGCSTVRGTIMATDGIWSPLDNISADCGGADSGFASASFSFVSTTLNEGNRRTQQTYYPDVYLRCIACESSSDSERCVSISQAVDDRILGVYDCPYAGYSECQMVHVANDNPAWGVVCNNPDYRYLCPTSLSVAEWVC